MTRTSYWVKWTAFPAELKWPRGYTFSGARRVVLDLRRDGGARWSLRRIVATGFYGVSLGASARGSARTLRGVPLPR